MDKRFTDIIQLIQQSRNNAIKAVNIELINLYWNIGAYVKQKLSVAEWGDKTVNELPDFIKKNYPELKGFSRAGLYRMVQFYETYAQTKFVATAWVQIQNAEKQETKIVATVGRQLQPQHQDIRKTILAQLSWSHHRTIFSRCKTEEEREFYLRMSIKENYSVRELDRQINASLFERVMLGKVNIASLPKEFSHDITNAFKDSYVFEFLNLPEPHSESDLQKGLIKQMKNFILELGRDFIFIENENKTHLHGNFIYQKIKMLPKSSYYLLMYHY